jgi:hypothetical protein
MNIARKIKLYSLFAILLAVLNIAIFGATLKEYKETIARLQEDIAYLLAPAEDETAASIKDYEDEIAEELEELIKLKVEYEGTNIETDNKWLVEKFQQLKKEPNKRQLILTEISERLAAIQQKIIELENAATSNRSKNEEKSQLGEILKRQEYQKPEKPEESLIQSIMRKIDEWFKRNFPKTNIPNSAPEGFSSLSFVLQMLLYAVILGAIGYLIYRFAPFLSGKFRRRNKREKEDRVILGEKLGMDEDSHSLFSEAEALAREGNLRGAIRKGYIALLCELSDRKVIGLAQHKTNRDYLRDVRKNQPLHQNMNGLTNSFERHWYGFEDANENDWNEFKQNYRQTINSGT